MARKRIALDPEWYQRLVTLAADRGYASAEECVVHLIETALAQQSAPAEDPLVRERLRGLGYLE